MDEGIDTLHRNHCPYCLWSRHVDESREGDRKSVCISPMVPIGLTLKKIKPDKYHPEKKGELMIIHKCQTCQKISINRIAADDDPIVILGLLDLHTKVDQAGIDFLDESQKTEVVNQLYGRRP